MKRLINDSRQGAGFCADKSLITYEYFIQNDKVKSLYRLSDKTQELVRCMQYEDDIDTFLDEYMYNQRLDGIVVLDGEGECESCRGMEYTDIDSVIDDSNVKDVIEHPQKVYITRVNARSGSITYTESQNEEFSDIAVAGKKRYKRCSLYICEEGKL